MKQRHSKFVHIAVVLFYSILAVGCSSAAVDIRVQCDQPTVPLSPVLYGIFFEDINFAADGGLYAEMVQNRSFEYYPIPGGNPLSESYVPLYAWEKVERGGAQCSLSVDKIIPLNRNNLNYLVININNPGEGAGVMNTGFDGLTIDAGEKYDVSFYARREGGRGRRGGGGGSANNPGITAALELPDGTVCGSATFNRIGGDWQKYEGVITADKTADNARLVLTTGSRGRLYLDMVSVFPQKTFKGRKNGMRADLAQALADLEPKFFRFPGGCLVHGQGLANAYRWKETVGDVAERQGNWNRWGYHQTYGLGYYEYFQLCEDIGAAPLPVLPVGVSCGFTPPYEVCPMEDLDVWIDDALDLIEWANGPADSIWGKVRAKMGHPEPFGLEYICLGNEEHDRPEMRERFPHFVTAIREKYPDIKIIGTSGLGASIPIYDLMTELDVYSSDEHYYMAPGWFINNQNRFDDFDRDKPKIFVGEYASHSQNNSQFDAVAEAVFLTGIERNGDIVDMTCYAPLFAHYDHTQWNAADLIWFDKRNLVKTPNYYVQQLFSRNTGDVYLKNTVAAQKTEPIPTLAGAVGIASWDTMIEVQNASVNGTKLDPSSWKPTTGDFEMQDDLYVQTSNAQPAVSFANRKFDGETVTYTVRARKTGGSEGFMLVFGATDDQHYYWWNVGGWGNTQHAIERIQGETKAQLVERRGSIRDNTWYTMKVELSPGRVRCWLDDELIHDYEMATPSVSVSSTLDKDANEVIVKLVNPTEDEVEAKVYLDGVNRVQRSAQVKTIAGPGNTRNSRQNPEAVKTVTEAMTVGKEFEHTIPAMSVQFIRVKVE